MPYIKLLIKYNMTFYYNIFSINGTAISGQINYVTCLNSNFYLIKISKTPPKKCNSSVIISNNSYSLLESINFSLNFFE